MIKLMLFHHNIFVLYLFVIQIQVSHPLGMFGVANTKYKRTKLMIIKQQQVNWCSFWLLQAKHFKIGKRLWEKQEKIERKILN